MLLGANGSGKSTLLKLLDGIIAPVARDPMRALGRDVAAVADGQDAFRFHREVGLVFQDPDVQLFSATVFDDVAFGPLQLGLPAAEVQRRCDEALAAMDIADLAERAPFELSGGEKKRAAIASVLSLEPRVVLLDEPTASLDPRTKWVLVDLIGRLAGQGRTLVTATHELDIVPHHRRAGRRARGGAPCARRRRARRRSWRTGICSSRANLIHEHLHEHGGLRHAHLHPADERHHDW